MGAVVALGFAVPAGRAPVGDAPTARITHLIAGHSLVLTDVQPPEEESGFGDAFGCVTGCGNALDESWRCQDGRDYSTTISDHHSAVTVLSFHGGGIEEGSSDVTRDLSSRFGWNRYDFDAHGSWTCLDGLDDYGRLHITAANFNDRSALYLVGRSPKSLAIHSYWPRGLQPGTICVGGANNGERDQFISALDSAAPTIWGWPVQGVDATRGTKCSGLSGTDARNLVNRNEQGAGLQLEMSEEVITALADPSNQYADLRAAVYGAVADAMDS